MKVLKAGAGFDEANDEEVRDGIGVLCVVE